MVINTVTNPSAKFKPGWKDIVLKVLNDDTWFCTIDGGLFALEEFDLPGKLEGVDLGSRFGR